MMTKYTPIEKLCLSFFSYMHKVAIKLNAFTLRYVPLEAMKGQVLADFLAEHQCIEI